MSDRMSLIARRECPEHGADLGHAHHLRRLAGLCAHCGREQIVVEYVPASQLRGAVALTPEELRLTLRAWAIAATMLEALDQDDDARMARALVDRVTAETDIV